MDGVVLMDLYSGARRHLHICCIEIKNEAASDATRRFRAWIR